MAFNLSKVLSGFFSTAKLNQNFTDIEDKVNNDVVHRQNGSAQMQQSLDMNSNEILNVLDPTSNLNVTNKQYVDSADATLQAQIDSIEDYGIVVQNNEEFTASLGQTSFTLTTTSFADADSVGVYINGVRQSHSSYSTVGTTDIVFSEGLSEGDKVLVTTNETVTSTVPTMLTVDAENVNSLKVSSVSGLLDVDPTVSSAVTVLNYHTDGTEGGGGLFYWDASKDKAEHNGGTIIDPDVVFPTDWSDQVQVATWFTAGTGAGCWVRQYDGAVNAKSFGVKGDNNTDDFRPLQQLLDYIGESSRDGGRSGFIPKGVYLSSGNLKINSQCKLLGEGFSKDHYSRISDVDLDFMKPEGTVIKATATLDELFSIHTDSNSVVKTSGVHVEGIAFLGNDLVQSPVVMRSVDRCYLKDVVAEGGIFTQLLMTTVDDVFTMPVNGATDLQQCTVEGLFAKAKNSEYGLVMKSGGSIGNVSMNNILYPYIRHANNTAYRLVNADSNTFIHPRATRLIADTGLAVALLGQDVAAGEIGYARTNVFYHMTSSQGGISNTLGDGSKPAVDNAFYGLNMDGGAPDIEITAETGTYLSVLNPRFSNIAEIQAPSVKAADTTYSVRNNAISQARTSLAALGNPNSAKQMLAGDGYLLDLVNMTNDTHWKLNLNSGDGRLIWTQLNGVNGVFATPFRASLAKTVLGSPYTMELGKSVFLVDASAANRVVNLFPANTSGSGYSLEIKIVRIDSSVNTVTIQTQGGDTINGGASETLAVGEGKDYVSDGSSAWYSY